MRKIAIAAVAVILTTLFGCQDRTFTIREANSPIYQDVSEWRNSTYAFEGPRKLERPGKIYIYQNYLFVLESGEGIHFIDNSDPSAPSVFGFLPVYACSDISIKNDFMYVDSYFDILAFDISDKTNPSLAHRINDAIDFDNFTGLPGLIDGYPIASVKETDRVVIGWEIKEVRDEQFLSREVFAQPNFSMDMATMETMGGSSVGIGGSMARFTINNDYLYTLKANELSSFLIGSSGNLSFSSTKTIDRTAETLFPYNNHLFMGTTTGMVIYSLTNPSTPEYVSHLDHIQACDPVVVDGNRAYVTMSTGDNCWGSNTMDVINVSSYSNPTIITSYWFNNPKGIGVDGNMLFLCDGDQGLKVFDKSDDMAISSNMLSHFTNINAFDVIPTGGVLIMTGSDGIYQYDYSDINDISQLSIIPVEGV